MAARPKALPSPIQTEIRLVREMWLYSPLRIPARILVREGHDVQVLEPALSAVEGAVRPGENAGFSPLRRALSGTLKIASATVEERPFRGRVKRLNLTRL